MRVKRNDLRGVKINNWTDFRTNLKFTCSSCLQKKKSEFIATFNNGIKMSQTNEALEK